MNGSEDSIARVLALTSRLTEALRADIDALDRGAPALMRTTAPDMQNLVGLYAREVACVRPIVKSLPATICRELAAATTALHDALAQHERRVSRVRNASEGMIRAIVDDVERKKRLTRTYSLQPSARPTPGAMLYNGVV